jgi:hypothetical protein
MHHRKIAKYLHRTEEVVTEMWIRVKRVEWPSFDQVE